MTKNIYSVGQINTYIKNMFAQDFLLHAISIKGEVSNCNYHPTGHIYFTLKDGTGALKAIMFAGNRKGLTFPMKDGDKVVVTGSVEVYERDGVYQVYARKIELDGEGNLYLKFEQLKKELEEMGMFAEEYKQPIPKYARTIGVVTAPTGAAVQDIRNIAGRRNPYVQLILYPALVQGEGAAPSIVNGIHALEHLGVDVIIVGRGGGSIEDLWAFNEEIVARAIFECSVPVISAVGHQTDWPIAAYVADLRAPTPSAAAELCVPDQAQVRHEIFILQQNIQKNIQSRLEMCYNKFNIISPAAAMQNEKTGIDARAQLLRQTTAQIQAVAAQKAAACTQGLHTAAAVAASLNPYAVLARGYTMVADARGRCLTTEHLKPGQKITVIGSNAAAQCTVDAVAPTQGNPEKEQTDEST